MSETTKKCHLCAEEIPLTATTCPFCGAQYKVTRTGYCPNCHTMRAADENDRCPVCGTALVDVRITSEAIQPEKPVTSSPKPANAPAAPVLGPAQKKRSGFRAVLVSALVMGLVGLCLLGFLYARPKISALLATSTPRPTNTPSPLPTKTATRTPRPSPTSTPLPVEVTFATIGDYPTGTRVSMTGVLVLFGKTSCRLECGLLLGEYANSTDAITIFVRVAQAGVEPAPNQMKALPENYGKWDIQVRLDDGNYALIGQRIKVTGRITETTSGNPAISDIMKIELVP